MEINLIVILKTFIIGVMVSRTFCEDDCRVLDFMSTGVRPEQSLSGHVIKTVELAKGENCQIQCFIEHRCVSFNLGQNNGRYICELSDSDQTLHPEDIIQRNGYSYHGSTNPCQSSPCVTNATCLNGFTDKGYQCKCPQGYTGKYCHEDIDECHTGSHDCDANATCNNTIGSFDCSCLDGFSGNGKKCTVIQYFLASKGKENCDIVCQSKGLQCVETGGFHTGDAVSIFSSLGITCNAIITYKYSDNPCYVPTTMKCFGAKSIPRNISCAAGNNPDVRRLCPCY